MEDFHAATGFLMALVDLDGDVLVAMGWQDVCTKFHRCNPETSANCTESDTVLTRGVERGQFKAYKCKNGMWDVVTPLYVEDLHMGNVFVGQFFYDDETPDMAFFERQALACGFDRDEYLSAVARVPRFSHAQVDGLMRFYVSLAEQVARAGYANFRLSAALESQKRRELYAELDREVMEILNHPCDLDDCLRRVVDAIKAKTNAAAVGIRLQQGEDFPYAAQRGFSAEHVAKENSLVCREEDGSVKRDARGRAVLECTCGFVLSDTGNSALTPGGSTWTADSEAALIALETDEPRVAPRNLCVTEGYGSIAIVPIRDAERAIGLIHLADWPKGAFTVEMVEQLEGIAVHLGEAIARRYAEDDLRSTNTRLEGVLKSVVTTIGKVVESRDPYTQGHQTRVAEIGRLIGEEMGLSKAQIDEIEIAGLVHDVGKLAVPAEILTRPGTLNDLEFNLIRNHSQAGGEILEDIDFGRPIARIVVQHHERMDGSGYPNGLVGSEIMQAARILMVADVIEAMSTHRPYRAALGVEAAMTEFAENPERFDPEVVEACARLVARGLIHD